MTRRSKRSVSPSTEPMTTESPNLTLIRYGLAAFSRGDFDAGVENMQPDIEWYVTFRLPDLAPDKTIYRGTEEVRMLWAAMKDAWETFTVAVEEVIDDRDDATVVRVRFVGRPLNVDVAVDRVLYYVFEIADGKLRRLRPFDTQAEALAAAGR
jgi:ketosteroid isomerase-like protein